MEGMYIVLGGVGIVACCLYLWSAFTKSGKKWIETFRAFHRCSEPLRSKVGGASKPSPSYIN